MLGDQVCLIDERDYWRLKQTTTFQPTGFGEPTHREYLCRLKTIETEISQLKEPLGMRVVAQVTRHQKDISLNRLDFPHQGYPRHFPFAERFGDHQARTRIGYQVAAMLSQSRDQEDRSVVLIGYEWHGAGKWKSIESSRVASQCSLGNGMQQINQKFKA